MPIVIGYLNRIYDATLSGGSWLAAAPLTELKTRRRSRCARSTDATNASTRVDLDFGAAVGCRGFCLPAHNFSSAAKWKIIAGPALSSTAALDTGWLNAQQIPNSPGIFDWGDSGFWEGTGDPFVRNTHPVMYVHSAQVSARHWSIFIDDTANPDNYVQFSLPFIGPIVSPAGGDEYPRPEGFTDYTTFDRAGSGVSFARRGLKAKRTELDLSRLTDEEIRVFRGIVRREGADADVLWAPSDSDAGEQQEYGFVGTITAGLDALARTSPANHGARITLEERL